MKSMIGMNKRIAALITALLLLLGPVPTLADAPAEEPELPQELVVANPTAMKGDFFTMLWGNSTSDIDVRALLHGYDLILWDGQNGMFVTDPSVVSGVFPTVNEEGDHTYMLVLYDDLYFSDGTPITAWDYAFSFLLALSPELAATDARPTRTEHIVGAAEYANGESKVLSGVRVLADDTLAITLDHEYLPFFYEMALLACRPYPISVIAPGVAVRDDGVGVYLANEDETIAAPVFTAELLRKTVLDPETGYRSHPSVVSGPYTLASWDGVTAEFDINPYFKGNKDGDRPSIPHLVYTLADNEDMVEKIESGEIGLLNKVTNADSITACMALAAQGDIMMSAYPRTGLTYISFACEKPAVASRAVRQAIAWCMDRNEALADYAGFFGLLVDGYYGIGQWMVGVVNGTTAAPVEPPEDESDAEAMAAYEADLLAYEELSLDNLTTYTLDTAAAAALLDGDGWALNADGLREKEIDGEKVVLDLVMVYPEGNEMAEIFEELLVPNLAEVGIRLTLEPMPMVELLQQYYKREDRSMDMVYLGSNFETTFDPSVSFLVDEEGRPNWSYTNNTDEELWQRAVDMRRTEPGNILEYCQKWVAFQERFNESLPMLPIYSNIYFDFYPAILRDYAVSENCTWSEAIVPAYFAYDVAEESE